jgi:hypothetical protein
MQVLVILLGPIMRGQIWIVVYRAPGGDGVWIVLKRLAVKQPATPSKGWRVLIDEVVRICTDRLDVIR